MLEFSLKEDSIIKSAIITQSNYIPWKGYFDSIRKVDTFVVYDDMQYTKRDWRNRNLIKTPNERKWLTIPVEVKGKYLQKIKDTKASDSSWRMSHLDVIKQNYRSANSYKEVFPWIEELYKTCNHEFLTDINVFFITKINEFLNINTEIRYSSEFNLAEEKNQRLINICKDIGANEYYSGEAAKFYMDEALFNREGISVHYWDYSGYPHYSQLHPPFEHGVTIFDLLLNEGTQSVNFLKND